MEKTFERLYESKLKESEFRMDIEEFELIDEIAGQISQVFDKYFEKPEGRECDLPSEIIKKIWEDAYDMACTHNPYMEEILGN